MIKDTISDLISDLIRIKRICIIQWNIYPKISPSIMLGFFPE